MSSYLVKVENQRNKANSKVKALNEQLNTLNNIKWNSPEETPVVNKGCENLYWIAVEAGNPKTSEFKTVVFLAYYQNRPLEQDEDGEYLNDDYLVDDCGEPYESVGWVDCKAHHEFDDYYVKMTFNDHYQFVGWSEYMPPEFTGVDVILNPPVKAKCPWPDYAGNDLFDGDIIKHPDGESGIIEFISGEAVIHRKWGVNYGDNSVALLILQIGDKGQAVKVVKNVS